MHIMYTLSLLYEMLMCAGNKLNWGWEILGSTFQKFGRFHELPRKLIHVVTPHPTHPRGRGILGETISASSFKKYLGNAIILSNYTANIPGEAG